VPMIQNMSATSPSAWWKVLPVNHLRSMIFAPGNPKHGLFILHTTVGLSNYFLSEYLPSPLFKKRGLFFFCEYIGLLATVTVPSLLVQDER